MHDLKTLQDAFARHLLANDDGITAMICDDVRVRRESRLAIYHNAYHARLMETLEKDFPCLAVLLGEEDFTILARAYIQAHPSQHFSLRYFGRQLAAHLGYVADKTGHYWSAEMACFEWALTDSFDAADTITLSERDAAAVLPQDWPRLRLAFHPSVRIVPLQWNTLTRWRAVKQEEMPPAAQSMSAIDVSATDQIEGVANLSRACVVWRNQLNSQFRSMTRVEQTALQTAMDGGDFSDICGSLVEFHSDEAGIPLQAAGFLKTWLGENMIIQLITE